MKLELGQYQKAVDSVITDLTLQNMTRRIWGKDHTVWNPDPAEIVSRLGWLTVTDSMRSELRDLMTFAGEVRESGFRHVVLLGMGGSSLGAEVLGQTFSLSQVKGGFPKLIVLDSTIPERIQAVTDAIDTAHTLFLVSSKSGTTTETVCLMQYFLDLVESRVEREKAGRSFVAITDSGTPLARQAKEEGFRRVFLNPPDVGGRYSVLSYFGLVPAALVGVDIQKLLDRADLMRGQCAPSAAFEQNPGALLGTIMAALAREGRDKLTLVTSPGVSSFGLWVEQLIAESTGKNGKGIIPVAGEPLLEPPQYGDDRLFVYLRLQDDDNRKADDALARLKAHGQPVVTLELGDKHDLGAEFFRWEFATALAGATIGTNPFNEPNVQSAKTATEQVLDEFTTKGRLPEISTTLLPNKLLNQIEAGSYFGILAYLSQSPETDRLFNELRRRVIEKHHVATTLGYGPRYLHSTGQLHKGGPATGQFVLITASTEKDLAIPGRPHTFGTLAEAQALGDYRALESAGRPVSTVRVKQKELTKIIDSWQE